MTRMYRMLSGDELQNRTHLNRLVLQPLRSLNLFLHDHRFPSSSSCNLGSHYFIKI